LSKQTNKPGLIGTLKGEKPSIPNRLASIQTKQKELESLKTQIRAKIDSTKTANYRVDLLKNPTLAGSRANSKSVIGVGGANIKDFAPLLSLHESKGES